MCYTWKWMRESFIVDVWGKNAAIKHTFHVFVVKNQIYKTDGQEEVIDTQCHHHHHDIVCGAAAGHFKLGGNCNMPRIDSLGAGHNAADARVVVAPASACAGGNATSGTAHRDPTKYPYRATVTTSPHPHLGISGTTSRVEVVVWDHI